MSSTEKEAHMSRLLVALLVIAAAVAAVASIQVRRAGPTGTATTSAPAPTVVPIDRTPTAIRATPEPKATRPVAPSQRIATSSPAPVDRNAVRIARDPESGELVAPEHS